MGRASRQSFAYYRRRLTESAGSRPKNNVARPRSSLRLAAQAHGNHSTAHGGKKLIVSLDKGLAKLQGLKPCLFQRSIVAAEAAAHKADSVCGPMVVGHGFSRAINSAPRSGFTDCGKSLTICGSCLQARHKARFSFRGFNP